MRQGIHLGPPPARPPLLAGMVLVFFIVAALVLGISYLEAHREVSALGSEVASLEGSLAVSAEPLSAERTREVAARLRAVVDSGAAESVFPTTLLRFVTSALPEDVLLSSLAIDASPPARSVTLEATAIGGERVSELQRRLSGSPSISNTTLLEERRLPEGGLAVKLKLDLEEPEAPERR